MSHVSPSLKSFIYKTFCLPQFTYGLENLTLDNKTLKILNIYQNNLIVDFILFRHNLMESDKPSLESSPFFNSN
ncbi:hypothetical protein BpHYR1_003744 [Brachionus plicatilis]|uniref:Uncharacterized protein n=1 Tax=Brachionus plicatilis TaxID=10195 RepID=A0A3M7QTD8_BRAPC|nr:hypothetical protein BpHYR1_003744 [Brachionus plicatilis]